MRNNLNINGFLFKKIIYTENHNVIHFEELYFKGRNSNKYKNLKEMVLNNKFLSFEQKEYLFNIFNKYNIFSCFYNGNRVFYDDLCSFVLEGEK